MSFYCFGKPSLIGQVSGSKAKVHDNIVDSSMKIPLHASASRPFRKRDIRITSKKCFVNLFFGLFVYRILQVDFWHFL